jgi:hypothetical protein
LIGKPENLLNLSTIRAPRCSGRACILGLPPARRPA